MENHSKYILKVRNISVYTNLEVILKARTTNEEACKEVTRMTEGSDLFEGYDWKIEGCAECGILDFNDPLQAAIRERLEQEEPEDSVFWNGSKIQFELNVAHIPVTTHLTVPLKSKTKEEAVREVEAMCNNGGSLFKGYDWIIEGCAEGGINDFSADLQAEIIKRIGQENNIAGSIEEVSHS
jgi:hypothetical protein